MRAQKGRLSADRAEAIAANATGTLNYGRPCRRPIWIIEAAFESMNVKRQIFEALDRTRKTWRDTGLKHIDIGS